MSSWRKRRIKIKELSVVVGIILLIVFLIFAIGKLDDERKAKINDWAAENGCIVRESRMQTVFEPSPFWLVSEDDTVYRAEVVDKKDKVRIVWFKFHLFDMDVKREGE